MHFDLGFSTSRTSPETGCALPLTAGDVEGYQTVTAAVRQREAAPFNGQIRNPGIVFDAIAEYPNGYRQKN